MLYGTFLKGTDAPFVTKILMFLIVDLFEYTLKTFMRNKAKSSRKGDCLRELSFISRLYYCISESHETLIQNGQELNKINISYKYLATI